jgi:hypothetical protein
MLRAYQTRALNMARDAYRKGARRILVVSPVGSGKTTIGAEAARVHASQGGKVLWLAHRRELVAQAAERLAAFGLDVGHSGLREMAPVQVRTVQGVMARGKAPDATMVVADEAHHFVQGNDWRRAIDAYPTAIVLGLTATPERADGRGLGGDGGFQALVVAVQVSELQREGHLCGRIELPRAPRPLKPGEVARKPVDAYLTHAPGELAVVFAQHLKDAEAFRAGFAAAGVPVAIVSGKTPKDERARILDQWAAGAVRVVVNCNVLTEGFDLPALSCCIIARGCSSAGQLIQMCGRVMRPHADKDRAIILDLRGVTWAHGRPDADCDYSLGDVGIHMRGAPSGVCKFCGLVECACALKGTTITRSLDLDLVPWEIRYADAKAKIKPSRAALCLAGIMRKADDAAAKGKPWKKTAIIFRFRAIMKRMPMDLEWQQAEMVNRETRRGSAA